MRDQSKHRLALIHERFAPRKSVEEPSGETFEDAFLRVRDAVIRPSMEEVAAELRALGHAPSISVDPVDHEGTTCSPAIALALGIANVTGRRNIIVFAVVRWRPSGKTNDDPEVLAYHQKDKTAFDLFRYVRPDDITADTAEQLLVDSTESLFAQNAR